MAQLRPPDQSSLRDRAEGGVEGEGGGDLSYTLSQRRCPALLCLDKTHQPSSASGDDLSITEHPLEEMLICEVQEEAADVCCSDSLTEQKLSANRYLPESR